MTGKLNVTRLRPDREIRILFFIAVERLARVLRPDFDAGQAQPESLDCPCAAGTPRWRPTHLLVCATAGKSRPAFCQRFGPRQPGPGNSSPPVFFRSEIPVWGWKFEPVGLLSIGETGKLTRSQQRE